MNKLTYFQAMKAIRESVPADKRDQFDLHFVARSKEPLLALVLSFVFGTLGVDRFYNGNILLGLLKLFTLGGLYIWTIIDWFLIAGAVRQRNVAIATEIRAFVL